MREGEEAVFERVNFQFGEDAALRIQQQRQRATAFFQIFDVARNDGVQVAQAIRPREIDNGVPVGIEDRERFARGAVFVFERRESLGQHAAVIVGELGAGGLMQLDQRRFDLVGGFHATFDVSRSCAAPRI